MSEPKTRSPAEVYDEFFVPALFQQWGNVVAQAAGIGPGQRVLDVACGTGVLACAAAELVGNGGTVVGLDPNEEMLFVAQRKNASIEWQNGRAESLPFPDRGFDALASQFRFMFFEDQRVCVDPGRPARRCAVRSASQGGGGVPPTVCDG